VSRPHLLGSGMRLEWPRWVWRCQIGATRIRVYPTGLAALCLVQYVIGLALLWMLPVWVAIHTPEPITRATLDAMRFNWLGAAVYVPLAVLCTAVHELGHVVGARLAGTPAKSLVLGSHGRIYTETPATPGGQLFLKGSGPLAALAYGGLLLITATAVTTPVGAAGVWAVGNAVANLLPLPPANSDGLSSWRVVRALLATRPKRH
jgi:hypothetical protein